MQLVVHTHALTVAELVLLIAGELSLVAAGEQLLQL